MAGWARNRPDGKVEVVAEGEPEAVERLVQWLHRGPRSAEVSGVDVVEEEPAGLEGFETR